MHAYRNGTADCRFLTITGPGRGREFFERADAEIGWPPDMDLAVAVAARFGLKVLLPDWQANPGSRCGHYYRGDTTPWRVRR